MELPQLQGNKSVTIDLPGMLAEICDWKEGKYNKK
jgi:hypothetical protein